MLWSLPAGLPGVVVRLGNHTRGRARVHSTFGIRHTGAVRLSFNGLWTWIAIALPAFVALVVPLPAVDLAYQVRAGNEILATGALPAVDTWTFTVAGTPWVDQQWLAQVELAVGYAIGGWELLAVVRAGLVAAFTGVMVATAQARGASPRTAAILALGAFALAAPALALRPQLFALVLFAVLLGLVAVRDRRPRLYLSAPLVVLLWANVHGSFVLGPAILGYAWLSEVAAGRPARGTLAVLVAGSLATLLNPYLAGAWAYAAGIGTNPVIAGQVSEWQRASPLAMPGLLFYPSVAITAVLAWRGRATLGWPDWVLLAAIAAMGAWAVRGVAWWAPVMAFLLAGVLTGAGARRVGRASRVNGATAVLLGVLLVAALPWWRPPDPLTGRVGLLSYAPSALAAEVAARVQRGDRVVVPQSWSSWFEWVAPGALYFVDSRFELFPADVWADESALRQGGDAAAEVLERRESDLVVIAAGEVRPAGAWTVAWEDAAGAILVRGR